MQVDPSVISDRVRGVAAEKRFTHGRIARLLDCTRGTVGQRMNGSVPWTGAELLTLALAMDVPIQRFFPDPRDEALSGVLRAGLLQTA